MGWNCLSVILQTSRNAGIRTDPRIHYRDGLILSWNCRKGNSKFVY